MSQQPEAIRLAAICDLGHPLEDDVILIGPELRRLHGHIGEALKCAENSNALTAVLLRERDALRAQVERLQSDLDANAAAFDQERTERLEAQAQAKTLVDMVERLQAAGQVALPLAWMYHDGPSPDRIPSEMLGTVFVSLKRLPNYRNEIALVARSPAPAQEAADTGADEQGVLAKLLATHAAKQMFYRLDSGEGVDTDDGRTWLAARAALAASAGQVAASAMVPLADEAEDLDAWKCERCNGEGRHWQMAQVGERESDQQEVKTDCDQCECLGWLGPDAERAARAPVTLPRPRGVSRDAESPGGRGVLVFFDRTLSDDELRALHEGINGLTVGGSKAGGDK